MYILSRGKRQNKILKITEEFFWVRGKSLNFFCQKIYYWWSDPLTPLTIMETKGKLKEKMNRNLPERK